MNMSDDQAAKIQSEITEVRKVLLGNGDITKGAMFNLTTLATDFKAHLVYHAKRDNRKYAIVEKIIVYLILFGLGYFIREMMI